MSPQRQEQPRQNTYPTSPWTEAYHAMPSNKPQQPESTRQTSDAEALQPTHDALADIYNRGY